MGMTNQEAAKMICDDIKLHYDDLSEQYRKALNMAIDVLLIEQDAVEPKIDAFGHPYCPKCKILVYETWEFCLHCGQELQWNA